MHTEHLKRCLQTLESSLRLLQNAEPASLDYEVYRNAVVKSFELTLEISGKLLRRALKSYDSRPRAVDELNFKDVFRHAARHSLVESAAVTRWFSYRDNRNNTAHDYGIGFADETLVLLPSFLEDARALRDRLASLP